MKKSFQNDIDLLQIDNLAKTANYSGCHELYNICGTKETYQDLKPEKYVLHVKTTNRCNAKCDFCANKGEMNKPEAENGIFLRNLQEIVDQLVENKKLFRVAITGGEPLIDKERVTGIMDMLDKHKIYYSLNSNGIELPNYIDIFNNSRLGTLSLSRHDMSIEKVSEIFGVNKKFDVFESMKKLSPKIEVCIAFTITDINTFKETFENTLKELEKNGVYYSAFNIDMNLPFEETLQCLDMIDQIEGIVPILKRHSLYCACSNYIYNNKVAFYMKHLDLSRYNNIKTNNENFKTVKLVFHPDGKLYSEFVQDEKNLVDLNKLLK